MSKIKTQLTHLNKARGELTQLSSYALNKVQRQIRNGANLHAVNQSKVKEKKNEQQKLTQQQAQAVQNLDNVKANIGNNTNTLLNVQNDILNIKATIQKTNNELNDLKKNSNTFLTTKTNIKNLKGDLGQKKHQLSIIENNVKTLRIKAQQAKVDYDNADKQVIIAQNNHNQAVLDDNNAQAQVIAKVAELNQKVQDKAAEINNLQIKHQNDVVMVETQKQKEIIKINQNIHNEKEAHNNALQKIDKKHIEILDGINKAKLAQLSSLNEWFDKEINKANEKIFKTHNSVIVIGEEKENRLIYINEITTRSEVEKALTQTYKYNHNKDKITIKSFKTKDLPIQDTALLNDGSYFTFKPNQKFFVPETNTFLANVAYTLEYQNKKVVCSIKQNQNTKGLTIQELLQKGIFNDVMEIVNVSGTQYVKFKIDALNQQNPLIDQLKIYENTTTTIDTIGKVIDILKLEKPSKAAIFPGFFAKMFGSSTVEKSQVYDINKTNLNGIVEQFFPSANQQCKEKLDEEYNKHLVDITTSCNKQDADSEQNHKQQIAKEDNTLQQIIQKLENTKQNAEASAKEEIQKLTDKYQAEDQQAQLELNALQDLLSPNLAKRDPKLVALEQQKQQTANLVVQEQLNLNVATQNKAETKNTLDSLNNKLPAATQSSDDFKRDIAKNAILLYINKQRLKASEDKHASDYSKTEKLKQQEESNLAKRELNAQQIRDNLTKLNVDEIRLTQEVDNTKQLIDQINTELAKLGKGTSIDAVAINKLLKPVLNILKTPEFSSILKQNANILRNVGIEYHNGKFTINQDRLNAVAENNKNAIKNSLEGFIRKTKRHVNTQISRINIDIGTLQRQNRMLNKNSLSSDTLRTIISKHKEWKHIQVNYYRSLLRSIVFGK